MSSFFALFCLLVQRLTLPTLSCAKQHRRKLACSAAPIALGHTNTVWEQSGAQAQEVSSEKATCLVELFSLADSH